eukprot:gene34609-biopygen34360
MTKADPSVGWRLRPSRPYWVGVVAVKDTDVVTLEDRTGLKENEVSHIAPCFLQIKDEKYQMVNGMAHAVKTGQKKQRVQRRVSEAESTDAAVMERWASKLKRSTSALLEKPPSPTTVLEFDVGPRRVILKGEAKQPWLAVSLAQLQHTEERHWGAQKRADLVTVTGLKQLPVDCIMPGSWHEGHLTRLSRKCAKQRERSRSLRSEKGVVPR